MSKSAKIYFQTELAGILTESDAGYDLAKRFDRKKEKKIHVEDFCQRSEFFTENKYKGS
jgi:hypothetical protein